MTPSARRIETAARRTTHVTLGLGGRSRVAAGVSLLLMCACAPAPPPAPSGSGAPRYFGATTPPTDDELRFELATEPESIDPALAVGQPEGRTCRIMFEGLLRENPQTLEPTPGQAYRWEITPDGLVYTFHLRPGLVWSDGTPLRAEDFRWSWIRALRPETAARNAGLLAPIMNAEAFNNGELKDERMVGVAAPDESTLVVHLKAPTAYFLSLAQFYTFYPCPRHVIEKFGDRWTRPGNMVSNGPFVLSAWRQNDRFEFAFNPRYWDAAHVRLRRITAYTVDDLNTSSNLYKSGLIDWNPSGNIPSPFLPYMRQFADYRTGPYQGLDFYSINTTRPPLDNVWVRRALNYDVDRAAIAEALLKGTRKPWGNFTPSGYPGYEAPPPIRYDPAYARECLAKAGYPNGKGLRTIEILFNTSQDHRRIAEAIQAMWKRDLNIKVELANQEWATYLKNTTELRYDVTRRSWIGDYLDPNTFLASYISGDPNNRTGFSSPRYDALIHGAAIEPDPARRLELLRDAEALLLDQSPVIPIYHYMTTELVKPYVHGIYSTPLDVHPLTYVWIDHAWKRPVSSTVASAASAGRRGDAPAASQTPGSH